MKQQLSPDDVIKLELFNDPTELVQVFDFIWFWDFYDDHDADISRYTKGVYILGFSKERQKMIHSITDEEIEDVRDRREC